LRRRRILKVRKVDDFRILPGIADEMAMNNRIDMSVTLSILQTLMILNPGK
jgi:hypothetical protein